MFCAFVFSCFRVFVISKISNRYPIPEIISVPAWHNQRETVLSSRAQSFTGLAVEEVDSLGLDH